MGNYNCRRYHPGPTRPIRGQPCLGWGLIGRTDVLRLKLVFDHVFFNSVVCRFSHHSPFFQSPVTSSPPNPHRRPYLPNSGAHRRLRSRSISKELAPTAHVTAIGIFRSDHESPVYTRFWTWSANLRQAYIRIDIRQ